MCSWSNVNSVSSDAESSAMLSNGRFKDEYYRPYPPNHFAPNPGEQKLDVAVIGAGIAGLMTAVALVQSGHNVEVRTLPLALRARHATDKGHPCLQIYERSKFANEIGAAINMCPNAARILSYYEFDFARAMPTSVEEVSKIAAAGLGDFSYEELSPAQPCRRALL
jgi:2-polyprenyl-6-methoxyphenol hydroxylase-like FAD-dependent oxidoreductase